MLYENNVKEADLLQPKFVITGGARLGWVSASWPFATLTAQIGRINVKAFLIGEYSFSTEQVMAIERYTLIPFIGWGIKIKHTVADYPADIIFWCLCNPDKLIDGISKAGFIPQGHKDIVSVRHGIPVRWQVIMTLLIIWNGFFYVGMRISEVTTQINIYYLIPLAILFLIGVGLRKYLWLQKIILKPNRNFSEIKPIVNLLTLVFGFMLFVFILQWKF